ncbi:MAG: DHH family phosphoesterase [Candidatus Bathyarchaeota archaeon]|nr:DHH family phosphoesterase [Candidatus Bathyarchaeota archaeon]MDH5732322.1 DHH family phosphoesterase [Candidatus Bathyarchaeota archaeon]
MPIKKEQIHAFINRASEAAEQISKHVEKGELIHVASHFDADGLAAAGIIGRALLRLEATFRLRIEKWIDEKIIRKISADKPPLIIFTDLGSGYLDLLNAKLSGHRAIILDHHEPTEEPSKTFTQVNPHLHEIDGSRDLSGAGVAYFVAKALNKKNVDLACVAVVGALADLQDKYEKKKLGGVNEKIVEDAINAGCLQVDTDLLFFGRETRPIHKALARTTNPFIPGISGEEDKSLAFLANFGITPKREDRWRALRDLSKEEKKKLFSGLSDYLLSKGLPSDVAFNLLGNVYTLTKEESWTPLRDAREFAVLLNATGRMDKQGLGVAICMGDRGVALDQANEVLQEYRRTITKYLGWLNEEPGRIKELDNIYVVHGENYIDENIIGTVSSILSTSLPNPEKPVIAFSIVPGEEMIKISARTLEILTRRGLNLGEIMRNTADKYSGRGGGHNIAAGAQVPLEHLDSFIKSVDHLVQKQLEVT